jgi:hypothetical protein
MVLLYLPSVFIIENYGLNRSLQVSISLTTLGLWLAYTNSPTLGIVFISIGMPFVINCTTKVAGAWFGPKGRNIATTIMLLAVYSSMSIGEFLGS